MYNLQQGDKAEWIDYDEMVDYIDLVIAYERQRKAKKTHGNWKKPERNPTTIEI